MNFHLPRNFLASCLDLFALVSVNGCSQKVVLTPTNEDLIVLGNWLFDVLDLYDVRWTVSGKDSGFHNGQLVLILPQTEA